jgi:hypothetical protein
MQTQMFGTVLGAALTGVVEAGCSWASKSAAGFSVTIGGKSESRRSGNECRTGAVTATSESIQGGAEGSPCMRVDRRRPRGMGGQNVHVFAQDTAGGVERDLLDSKGPSQDYLRRSLDTPPVGLAPRPQSGASSPDVGPKGFPYAPILACSVTS